MLAVVILRQWGEIHREKYRVIHISPKALVE